MCCDPQLHTKTHKFVILYCIRTLKITVVVYPQFSLFSHHMFSRQALIFYCYAFELWQCLLPDMFSPSRTQDSIHWNGESFPTRQN